MKRLPVSQENRGMETPYHRLPLRAASSFTLHGNAGLNSRTMRPIICSAVHRKISNTPRVREEKPHPVTHPFQRLPYSVSCNAHREVQP